MVESLDASNTPDPQPAIKHMLGWNRKALRLTLPALANTAQIAATLETSCTTGAALPITAGTNSWLLP